MICIKYNKYVLSIGIKLCFLRQHFTSLKRILLGGKYNILIIKDDGVGDAVAWIPYAFLLRNHFIRHHYHITVLASSKTKRFFQQLQYADKVISLPAYKNKMQWICVRLIFWLCYQFDIILSATCTPNDILLPYRVPNTLFLYRWHYKRIAKLCHCNNIVDVTGLNIYERYDTILHYLKIKETINHSLLADSLNLPDYKIEDKSFFAVCATASDSLRCWEEEKFAELINLLISTTGKIAVLVGMKSEYAKNERIKSICKHHSKIINLAGKTSIMELFSVIQKAEFLVSNETGTAHIGGILGILTFIICGGGDYGSFVPYPPDIEGKTVFSIFPANHDCFRCGWSNPDCTKEETYPCIKAISVNRVFTSIMNIIKTYKAK